MARKLCRRYQLDAILHSLEPLHIGGFGDSFASDMPLWRDGRQRLCLPGSSLAGVLRHSLEQQSTALASDVTAVFGPWLSQRENDLHASHICVEDAPCLDAADDFATELLHHVRIDRFSGTAQPRGKFDSEVVPRGKRFELRLSLASVDQAHDQVCRRVLAAIARLLLDGELRLGGGTTRGQGSLHADAKASLRIEDWSTPAGVRAWLSRESPVLPLADWLASQGEAGTAESDTLRIEVDWQPEGALMSKSAEMGLLVDTLPLVSSVENNHCALLLPGSSIKGVLRSRAERIVRSLLGRRCAPSGAQPAADENIDLPLVGLLFGQTRKTQPAEEPDPEQPQPSGWRGSIAVRSCYSRWRMPAQRWRDAVVAAPSAQDEGPPPPLPEAAAMASQGVDAQGVQLDLAWHVAVDRWTGGAAPGLLFNAIELQGISWMPLCMDVEMRVPPGVAGLPAADTDAAWMLLLHLLADLRKGDIALGYGANRGYGGIRVNALRFSGRAAAGSVAASLIAAQTLDAWLTSPDYAAPRAALLEAWQGWLARQAGEEQGHD